MALAPLATAADLKSLLGEDFIPAEKEPLADELLRSASEVVREAAGQIFTRTTSTVTIQGGTAPRLRLYQQPVVSIDEVLVDGVERTGWRLIDGELYHAHGWTTRHDTADVTITYTHGYLEVPRPVRDLVIQLAAAALTRIDEEGLLGSMPGVRQESISETAHSITYGSDEPAPISIFELPERTRRWLRQAYGTGDVGVVTSR